jgi:hypothetical protein
MVVTNEWSGGALTPPTVANQDRNLTCVSILSPLSAPKMSHASGQRL